MSVHVLSWVLRHSPVENHPQRLMLICLADKANDDGSGAYPGIATIMCETKIKSRTTVREGLRDLEHAGRIEYEGISQYQTKIWRVLMTLQAGGSAYGPPPVRRSRDDPKPSLRTVPRKELSRSDGLGGSGPAGDPHQCEAWEAIRGELVRRAPAMTFAMWLEPLALVGIDGHALAVAAPKHAAGHVQHRYLPMLTAAAREVLGAAATVDVTVGEPATTEVS